MIQKLNNQAVCAACVLVAMAGSSTSASIFHWIGGNGNWSNDLLWSGPLGQVPSSIADSATLSGGFREVLIDSNVSIGTLNVLNGMSLFTFGNSLFVNGDTQINGSGSTLVVRESPSLRELDTDTLFLKNGGILFMVDGLAQFDDALKIESSSGVLGLGVLEMNSTSGDLDLVSGAIWAQDTFTGLDTLTIRRTQTSTSRLNWTHPGSGFIAWDNTTIDVQIPYSGTLGGSISVSEGSEFKSSTSFVAGPGSTFDFYSGVVGLDGSSTISAPIAIDSYGALEVNGHATIRTPLLVLRGTGVVDSDSTLLIDSVSTVLNSFQILPQTLNSDGVNAGSDDGSIEFGLDAANLNVINGTSSFWFGLGSTFDLDGRSGMTVNIASGSSLILAVEYIERNHLNTFDSILNIDGTLDIKEIVPDIQWINAGTINLDSGEIQGRTLVNENMIRGKGTVSANVYNSGEIVADGGSLSFDYVDFDGLGPVEDGIVRAQSGDVIVQHSSQLVQHFSGSMFVGNGQGIREVFESNGGIEFIVQNGAIGMLDLNGGFFRARDIGFNSRLITRGVSQIRASGATIFDLIKFEDNGTNTISGTLELDGNVVVQSGANFEGEGKLLAISTIRTTNLAHGTSTSDVGFESVGTVTLGEQGNGVGQISVGKLKLHPTSTLQIDFADAMSEPEFDSIHALDLAEVDGHLVLGVIDGAIPQSGQTYNIVTCGTVTGTFDTIDQSELLSVDRRAYVSYEPTRVVVQITCKADLYPDGVLNFFDVSAFINLYSQQDTIADWNQDGVFNFFDISGYIQSFKSGCP